MTGWMYLDPDSIDEVLTRLGERPDPFMDDEPLVCGVENPDECEACT